MRFISQFWDMRSRFGSVHRRPGWTFFSIQITSSIPPLIHDDALATSILVIDTKQYGTFA